MTIQEKLIDLKACKEARIWAGALTTNECKELNILNQNSKSWSEIYETCHRGDWLLWLFKKVNPDDLQLLTLAKGYCAKTVYHLMKDERSKKAVDIAIAFGEGKVDIKELNAAADAAANAADAAANAADAAANAANAASYAAYAAANAASYAASYAAYAAADVAAYVASYAADAADAARIKSQKETADICRKYLSIEVWNIM